jgi:hypothetical protein
MKTEEELISANTALLVHGDDTIITCDVHGLTKRWGDIPSLGQIGVLAGLDTVADLPCIMSGDEKP